MIRSCCRRCRKLLLLLLQNRIPRDGGSECLLTLIQQQPIRRLQQPRIQSNMIQNGAHFKTVQSFARVRMLSKNNNKKSAIRRPKENTRVRNLCQIQQQPQHKFQLISRTNVRRCFFLGIAETEQPPEQLRENGLLVNQIRQCQHARFQFELKRLHGTLSNLCQGVP